VIGVSEGERDFIDVESVLAQVRQYQKNDNYPIYMNADHTYSFKRAKEVIDAGYDGVIIDGAELSYDENVAMTKQVVDYAQSVNPDILVEAEIGYIGKSSKELDVIPEGVGTAEFMTKPDEAAKFVADTGVDLLAPAVGNLHGMLKGMSNPQLDIERIKNIRATAGVPLVLHGGSGITDEDFKKAIEAGISMVHINTEIRKAYRDGIHSYLNEHPDEVAPYRFLSRGVENLKKVVKNRLELFSL
jgi:fructose-bisphosphate aldolase class II